MTCIISPKKLMYLYCTTLFILALLLVAGSNQILFIKRGSCPTLYSNIISVTSTALWFTFSVLPLNPRAFERRTFPSYGFGWIQSHSNTMCWIICFLSADHIYAPSFRVYFPTTLFVLNQPVLASQSKALALELRFFFLISHFSALYVSNDVSDFTFFPPLICLSALPLSLSWLSLLIYCSLHISSL